MLPSVTSPAIVGGRHHSRSASCQAAPGGAVTDRSAGPNECTVTRLPRGVTPTAPSATGAAADASGVDEGEGEGTGADAADGSDDSIGGVDAPDDDGASLGADAPPHAVTSPATMIATQPLREVMRRPAIAGA